MSESIFEFGDGASFERDLAAAGFAVELSRSFLFGATGLWVARLTRRAPAVPAGEIQAGLPSSLHVARPENGRRSRFPQPAPAGESEWRAWTAAQLGFAIALVVALAWALAVFFKLGTHLPINPWQRRGLGFLLGLQFADKAAPIHQALLERQIITGTSSDPNVLRLLPPLCLQYVEVDHFVETLREVVRG